MSLITITTRVKNVSLKEYIDAIERNGLEQSFGILWDGGIGESPIKAFRRACALGQAAINLNVPVSVVDKLQQAIDRRNPDYYVTGRWLHAYILFLNDEMKLSLPQIAKDLREKYRDYLDVVAEDIGVVEYATS